jgi:alcohol dehydrogenase (cytochrome c)
MTFNEMTLNKLVLSAAFFLSPVIVMGQGNGVAPSELLKPLKDSWPTYSGDYTSKRYSALKQIDQSNVMHLTLAWMTRVTPGQTSGGGGGRFGRGGGPVIVGGEGPGDINVGGGAIKASALEVDGVLYFTMPDNAWAVDARDGSELWHYFWKTKGGTHIGNRGLGMWNSYLFMETPDDYLVSLDSKTGKERWHKPIADLAQGYFSTPAPVVIGNHVLVGTGNDLDAPGMLQSFDPETGDLQWRFYTVPMKPGDPGLDTWASLDAAKHGGGQAWVTGSYDPDTNLYIFSTGNPTPAFTTGRGEGDNLFTCAIVALNVDTGKMAWYYSTSPHDMHDYDSAQTPVLVDGMFNGKMRKMVVTAARNGYWFTLDRVTGEHLVTSKYGLMTNWSNRLTKAGGPYPDPEKNATIAGSLVSPTSDGTTNWEPPSYSPDTGLFYLAESDEYSIFYLTDVDPRGSMGLGGKDEVNIGSAGSFLTAIDYRTGEVKWRLPYYGQGGGGGMLTTAGKLLFAGDGAGNLVAHDVVTGKPLWNTRIGWVTNPAQTYMLDGRQYVIAATGDTLWSFVLY